MPSLIVAIRIFNDKFVPFTEWYIILQNIVYEKHDKYTQQITFVIKME